MSRNIYSFVFVTLAVSLSNVYCDVSGSNFGEPVVYFPPFELRAVPADKKPFSPIESKTISGNSFIETQLPQLPLTKSVTVPAKIMATEVEHDTKTANHTHAVNAMHDLLSALGLGSDQEHSESSHTETTHGRAAEDKERKASARDYEGYLPDHGYGPPAYGHGYSHYGPYPHYQPHYQPQGNPYAYMPPTYVHPSPPPKPAPKPDLLADKLSALLKPKALPTITVPKPALPDLSAKLTGLAGLISGIKSLLGGSAGATQAVSLGESLLNGVVKPLMAIKSGIKSFIGKILLPVVILLLINLELLVLIWWLWEDCKQDPPAPAPQYATKYKPSYDPYSQPSGYGGYR